jgi:hypothetical protein
MAYDIFTGLPLDQSIQGAAFDEGGVTWGSPTYLVGDGAGAVKVGASMPGANSICGNFLPPEGTPKIRAFFKSGASRPASSHSLQLAMHCDGSTGSQYSLNGVRAGAPGYGFLQLWDVATSSKVEIAAATTNGNEYCLEVECLSQAAGQYRARLYNSSNGAASTLIATTPTLTLTTPRPSTAKMAQIWRAADADMRITRVETEAAPVADTTGPVLEAPTAAATGANSATGTVGTNEAGGTLYRLASTNASGVTAATVKAANRTQPVNATGQQTVNETGLTPGTTCYMWYYQEDAAGNPSNVVVSAAFSTPAPDTTAPTWPNGAAITPGVSTSSSVSGSYPAASDANGVTYEKSKDGGTTWEANGSGLSFTFTGLASGASFQVQIRPRDPAGNIGPALSASISTTAALTGSFKSSPLSNGAQSAWPAGTAVVWEWLQGGRIGSAPTSTTRGAGALASDRTLAVTGCPLGAGILMIAKRNASAAADDVYYEAGTVT